MRRIGSSVSAKGRYHGVSKCANSWTVEMVVDIDRGLSTLCASGRKEAEAPGEARIAATHSVAAKHKHIRHASSRGKMAHTENW